MRSDLTNMPALMFSASMLPANTLGFSPFFVLLTEAFKLATSDMKLMSELKLLYDPRNFSLTSPDLSVFKFGVTVGTEDNAIGEDVALVFHFSLITECYSYFRTV